ncbi:MAG: ABC transporter ATP-binding protein [Chthonomonadaceae bacterium]|nr:ABC transporter ATP-binding protein [Chthonomonadaceae bacterium]
MLEVRGLTKDYKSFRAAEGVSFSVQTGEIVGLLGPNGAGKTTILRCCAGILCPTHGNVLIDGHDIVLDQARAKSALAYVPEVPSLYELLTVDEHLKFVAMCFDTVDMYETHGDALLDKYDLIEKKHNLVATLSKGMRQKLAIACAMVHRARVFLFDEPMIGIDPAGVAEFKREVTSAKESGCSILVSTHLLDTAERLCDKVVIMARGKVLAAGTLQELRDSQKMADADLEHVFLNLTEEAESAPASLPPH